MAILKCLTSLSLNKSTSTRSMESIQFANNTVSSVSYNTSSTVLLEDAKKDLNDILNSYYRWWVRYWE
ncbi:hypothetical protein CYY_001416 [Polysphondylium violaceum]|uniref:Uncharacterized protein n=1 Tax=Polysphondylium violaceum TaxID=133409 RepID=A0A8J4Q9F5_9MYCE|nr:hypothetical protein CYY_001416 [Polysphondylium violaceum]